MCCFFSSAFWPVQCILWTMSPNEQKCCRLPKSSSATFVFWSVHRTLESVSSFGPKRAGLFQNFFCFVLWSEPRKSTCVLGFNIILVCATKSIWIFQVSFSKLIWSLNHSVMGPKNRINLLIKMYKAIFIYLLRSGFAFWTVHLTLDTVSTYWTKCAVSFL